MQPAQPNASAQQSHTRPPGHAAQAAGPDGAGAPPAMDFEAFTDVLCGIAIRTGLSHQLDQILTAARTPAERVLGVAQVLTEAAATDPGVSRILDRIDAMTLLRNEVIERLGRAKQQGIERSVA